jgi:hypothetical protein
LPVFALLALFACESPAQTSADAASAGCDAGRTDGADAAAEDAGTCCDRSPPDVDLIDAAASPDPDAYRGGYTECWGDAYASCEEADSCSA